MIIDWPNGTQIVNHLSFIRLIAYLKTNNLISAVPPYFLVFKVKKYIFYISLILGKHIFFGSLHIECLKYLNITKLSIFMNNTS